MAKLGRGWGILALALLVAIPFSGTTPPFTVNWQGVHTPIPRGGHWFGQCVLGGKIYLFGGLGASEAVPTVTLNNTQVYDPGSNTWTAGAPMPTARYLCTAVAVGGKIYVMGGRTIDASGNGGPVNVNEMYDPASNTWTAKAVMPAAVRGHQAVGCNGKIYVFGGNTGTYQATVNIYNPSTNAWTTGASMPGARAYGAAVYVPSRSLIYYIGGDNGGTWSDRYYGNAITYDPVGNVWDPTAIPMYDKVSNFACAFDSSKSQIYIISGTMWNYFANVDGLTSFEVQVLDTASNIFSLCNALPPSPQNRVDSTAAWVSGAVYLMGGDLSDRLVDSMDTSADVWFSPNAPMPQFSAAGNCFAMNGKLFLLNGYGSDFNSQVMVYDPATNSWCTTNSINPLPRDLAVADVYNGKLVYAEGSVATGITGQATEYDPVADTFTSLAVDPTPTARAFGAVANGKLFVFGGMDPSVFTLFTKSRALDLTSKTWSVISPLPFGLAEANAVALNDKIYIFGGVDNSPDDYLNDYVIIYDPLTDSYSSGAAMPIPVRAAASTVYGNSVLIFGGETWYVLGGTRYYRPTPFLQVYDPATDTFSSDAGIYERAYHSMATIGDSLFMVGGDDLRYLEDRLDVAVLAPAPPALAAQAAADVLSGAPPLNVNFTGTATGGTSPFNFDWDFGDGSAHAATQNPSHTYPWGGLFTAKLVVTDSSSIPSRATATVALNVTCPSVTLSPPSLVGASVGMAYSQALWATGAFSPYTFAVSSGSLPPGLNMASTGRITGTPTSAGTYGFMVTATDLHGCVGTRAYTLVTSGYDLSFKDDLGQSKLCLNSSNGHYLWTVFTGAGKCYSGTARVTSTATCLTITTIGADPQRIFFSFYKAIKAAQGSFQSGLVVSTLHDANTVNDPPGLCD